MSSPDRHAEYHKKLGLELRDLRKGRHLSTDALAEYMGISVQQVQKYETGQNRISVGTLNDFAKIFGPGVWSIAQRLKDL